jgi:3-hydroxyisobutyrate dehydrogenase-like beta-hydroxyacid dehydrogenase
MGVVGAGAMGMQVAKRLLECGSTLSGISARRPRRRRKAAGATVAAHRAGRPCRFVVTPVVDAYRRAR